MRSPVATAPGRRLLRRPLARPLPLPLLLAGPLVVLSLSACQAPPDPVAAPVALHGPPSPSSSSPATSFPVAPSGSPAASPREEDLPLGAPIAVLAENPEVEFRVYDLETSVWIADGDRLGRLENGTINWDSALARGLPKAEAALPTKPRPFGRWPDAAFLLLDAYENGQPYPVLFGFEPAARRWRPLGWAGNFRASLSFERSSASTWAGLRYGFGVGGTIPIEVASLGPGRAFSKPRELACMSGSAMLAASPAGDGGFDVVCDHEGTTSLVHGSKDAPPVTVLSDLEARFGKPFYALALLAVGPGHAVMLFQTKEGEPGRSSRGVLDVRGSDARAEPLAMTGDLSAGYDGRGRVWVVETAPGGGASLWQIPVDAGGVGDAVVVEALPSHASLLGAEADHLWFSGAHGLALRNDSGEWLRYPLPDGVRYARPARDGGAWVEGAVVGRVGPR